MTTCLLVSISGKRLARDAALMVTIEPV
jgi:hypothetical protein